MTPFSDTAEQPTPGPVLVGVAMLGLTTLLSLPSPLFTGLLLAPVFGATAVLGYRRVRWAGFVGLGASAFALLTALIAAIVSTSQATAGSTLFAALGALLVGLCALAGGVGSGVLVIYRNHLAGSRRRTSFSPQQPPSTYESASASEREFPPSPVDGAAQRVPPQTPSDEAQADAASQRRDEDLRRVGRAAATGARALARGGAAAWGSQRRRAAAREERAAREAAARGPAYFSTQAMATRKREREDAEIRKAQLSQAYRYNNRR
ncbi:hypothetical protein [Brachybacterium alimentarium]|uniref:hypothetical protein n=1 Tax=Brachybacterium alimentarium TaxID=47845 RepID=UPI003FD0EDC0